MITRLVIFIVIYIICVLLGKRWLRKAYSAGGRWSNINPNFEDIIVVFLPGLNLAWIWCTLFVSNQRKQYKPPRNYNKFFKIKK